MPDLQCSNEIKCIKMTPSQLQIKLNSVIDRGSTYIVIFQSSLSNHITGLFFSCNMVTLCTEKPSNN